MNIIARRKLVPVIESVIYVRDQQCHREWNIKLRL